MGVGGKTCSSDDDCKDVNMVTGTDDGKTYVCGSVSAGGESADVCVDKESCGKSAMGVSISCGPNIVLIIIIIIVVILIIVGVVMFMKKRKAAAGAAQPAGGQQVGQM